jgi:methionyl-tRNA formyltransferase
MGSATFALPSLNAVSEAGHNVAAVFTQPDKPSGRGQSLQAPPVKKRAIDLSLPVHQPQSLKTDETRQLISAIDPALIVVVAYGKILPKWLLEFPKYGCLNLHGSLLPKYRGAAPVHWAVANGETATGVCTMHLDEGLDTGPVYLSESVEIGTDETVPELYGRLAAVGAPLLVKTIEGIVGGTLHAKPQDGSQASLAPPLKKEDGFLNWSLPAQELHNHVRAFNPWPGTVARFRDHSCKILKTAVVAVMDSGRESLQPGSVMASKGRLAVMCGDGWGLEILTIQPENRKAVSGSDFANGARIQPGEKFIAFNDNGHR